MPIPRLILTLITLAFIPFASISAAYTLRGYLTILPGSPPVAVNDSYTVHGYKFVPGNSVLTNDYDPDGDPLHLANCSTAGHGNVSCDYTYNAFSYTPAQGYVGSDSFTYQACDNSSCSTATVSLSVVNNAPTPLADGYIVRGRSISVAGPSIFGNDTDPDNDGLNFVSCGTAAHGTAISSARMVVF